MTLALQGAVMQIICHGISTGALFILGRRAAGAHPHARDGPHGRPVGRGAADGRDGLLFALASMGLPGLGNFIGEFLVLVGTYRVSPLTTVLAALGLIVSTVYALWLSRPRSRARIKRVEAADSRPARWR